MIENKFYTNTKDWMFFYHKYYLIHSSTDGNFCELIITVTELNHQIKAYKLNKFNHSVKYEKEDQFFM